MSIEYRYAKQARHQRILDALVSSPTLRMNELSEALGVSAETVRRDLKELDLRGLVSRTYGGAVRAFMGEPAIAERRRLMIREREAIAATVSALIRPGEVLLIGAGATTFHVAQRIARDHFGLTVVTHAIDVITAVGANETFTVIATPGHFDPREGHLVGHETCAFLDGYVADRAILGASGVTAEGFSNAEAQAAAVYTAMMRRAAATLIVADHAKFDIRSLRLFGGWGPEVTLVTDKAPEGALAEGIHRRGSTVLVAEPG
jgi:DeoR/GlpR family transcriptional regulator of sugar metabolism